MKRGKIIVNLTSLLFLALLCNGCRFGDCGDNNHYGTKTLSNIFTWRNFVVFVVERQQRTSSMYISQIQFLSGNMLASKISPVKQLS